MVSTYVLPVILLVIILINSVMLLKIDLFSVAGIDQATYEQISSEGNSVEAISDGFQMGFDAGYDASVSYYEGSEEEIEVDVPEINLWGEGLLYYDDVETIFQQSVATLGQILLLAIFVGIYIGDVYRYKFDKNLVVAWLSTVLCAALMADSVKFNIDKASIIYFIVTYLLVFAFGLVIMVITNATRSKAAGITIGVILSSGILSLAVSLATLLAINYLNFPDDFNCANCFLSQN